MESDVSKISNAAFDYIGSINQERNLTATQTTMSQPPNQNNNATNVNTSYLSAAKSVPKPVFPKKDQAIVFHAEDGFKLFDYVKAVGEIIGAKNICFASRISNNRICIYLSKTEIVDQLVKTHPVITIGNINFNIRRLVSPTKRIVISNISPSIPHDLAENAVRTLGLQLASPVSFLKAGIPGDEYGHILSFRRQVYVFPPTDDFELQTSLVIPYDGNSYRIFLSTDRMECFICKQAGHIANQCPNLPTSNLPLPLPQDNLTQSPSTANLNTDTRQQNIPPEEHVVTQKRSLSSTVTSSDLASLLGEASQDNAMMPPPPNLSSSQKRTKPARKKRKTGATSEDLLSDDTKSAIREVYQKNPKDFVLPIDNLFAFLENSYDSSDPYLEALKFTTDIKSLLSNMHRIYPALRDRSIKNRFTRLRKKIKAHLVSEEFEVGSLSSITSQSSLDLSDEELYTDASQQSQESGNQ